MPDRMPGCVRPRTTWRWRNWRETTASWPRLASTPRKLQKGLRSSLLEVGDEPPHTHVLNDLVSRLQQNGLDTRALKDLPLRSLSRMAIQSRYPMDATPPSELFDPSEADQALATACEVLSTLKALDQATDS